MSVNNYPWYASYYLLEFPNGFKITTNDDNTLHTINFYGSDCCRITSLNSNYNLYGYFHIPYQIYANSDNSLITSGYLDIPCQGNWFDTSQPVYITTLDGAPLCDFAHIDSDTNGVYIQFEDAYYVASSEEDYADMVGIIGFTQSTHSETGNPMASGGKSYLIGVPHNSGNVIIYIKQGNQYIPGVLYAKNGTDGYTPAREFIVNS